MGIEPVCGGKVSWGSYRLSCPQQEAGKKWKSLLAGCAMFWTGFMNEK